MSETGFNIIDDDDDDVANLEVDFSTKKVFAALSKLNGDKAPSLAVFSIAF